MKPTHGGHRTGSGRKPTGQTTVKKTIAMPPDAWRTFDNRRGAMTRCAYLMRLLGIKPEN